MDVNTLIAEIKAMPGFADNVGMILAHNGVVRAWSRKDRSTVTGIRVFPDQERIETLANEFRAYPGIFAIKIHAVSGDLKPGDDLLFIVVAGDIRENVKPVLAELLDRVKAEAIRKEEITI